MADEKIKSNQARNNQKAAGGKPMVLEAEQVRGNIVFLTRCFCPRSEQHGGAGLFWPPCRSTNEKMGRNICFQSHVGSCTLPWVGKRPSALWVNTLSFAHALDCLGYVICSQMDWLSKRNTEATEAAGRYTWHQQPTAKVSC